MMKRIKYLAKVLLGLLITALLLWILLPKTSISDIIKSASSFSFWVILASFLLYICVYIFRAIRFRILLDHSLDLKDMFSIVCIHNLLSQIIPARLGEFSYIYMVRNRGVPLHKNISSIAIARLLDMCIISVIFLIGIATTPFLIKKFYFILIASIIVVAMILSFMFLISTKPEFFISLVKKITLGSKRKYMIIISSKIEATLNEFRILRSSHTLSLLVFSSLLVWLCAYLSMFFLMNSIFPSLTLQNIFLIATIPIMISVLPIYGLAGIGTIEIGFTFPLLIFAISMNDAVAASFAVHFMQLFFTLVLAAVGYAIIMIEGFKRHKLA
jgi:hypothetical protein